MPICQSCRIAAHDRCDNNAHAQLYRSCYCQHGPHGEGPAEPEHIAISRTQGDAGSCDHALGATAGAPCGFDGLQRRATHE
jgi:hypothetical protein